MGLTRAPTKNALLKCGLHLVALGGGGAAQRVRRWSAQQHAQSNAMWCISAFWVTTCAEVSFCVFKGCCVQLSDGAYQGAIEESIANGRASLGGLCGRLKGEGHIAPKTRGGLDRDCREPSVSGLSSVLALPGAGQPTRLPSRASCCIL
jgi:hypothetical protein